jgi:methyltransferase (TIGR00027 family)
MIASRPSLTAERVARRRAAHQVLDAPPVFDDPLALRILALAPDAIAREEGESVWIDRIRRAFISVRSRYVEDEVAASVAHGAAQYVILGAGLDTFAYRNPHPNLRVFEVDHPATQRWKRTQLDAAGIASPPSLVFVPVDFERERLPEELARAGFRPDRRAVFSCLGVVPYLGDEAIAAMLRFVASCARETTIVFDYSTPPDQLPPRQKARFDVIAARAASAGEPWLTFFEPAQLAERLRSLGFGNVRDLDADDLNRRYFSGRGDGLRIAGVARLGRIVRAEV